MVFDLTREPKPIINNYNQNYGIPSIRFVKTKSIHDFVTEKIEIEISAEDIDKAMGIFNYIWDKDKSQK
jgi:hypothetical protein